MQTQKKQTTLQPQASGSANVPPITNWVDSLLENLFPQEQNNSNILAAFDYEAYLRKEGYYA